MEWENKTMKSEGDETVCGAVKRNSGSGSFVTGKSFFFVVPSMGGEWENIQMSTEESIVLFFCRKREKFLILFIGAATILSLFAIIYWRTEK